jgi:hypothetical protein
MNRAKSNCRPTMPCSGRRSRLRRDIEWPVDGCATAAADGKRSADQLTVDVAAMPDLNDKDDESQIFN